MFLVPLDQPGITVNAIWTMGDERTNEVYLDNVFVPDDYVVGELNHGLPVHLRGSRPRAVHHVHVLAHQAASRPVVRVRGRGSARRQALKDDPVGAPPHRAARHPGRGGRVLGLRFVNESQKGGAAPTTHASEYKLYATELSRRLADASMDIAGTGSQLRMKTPEAPMEGRAESTYRYTVIDTIGGGASEIQKNIIARRRLGLPKNF